MTTKSTTALAFSFSKLLLAATLLSFGIGSAHAVVLSDNQAKMAANAIAASSGNVYNVAVTVAQNVTANTGASDAAANAAKIVKYLPSKLQALVAGRVGVGVALNYPNQLPVITAGLVSSNPKNVTFLVYQLAQAGGFDQASQIALGLNLVMRNSEVLLKQSWGISNAIMMAISNRAGISLTDRANQLGYVAANLTLGLTNSSKNCYSATTAIKTVATALSFWLQNLTANAENRESLIYNVVGNFALTVKNSGASPSTILLILSQAQTVFQQQFPGSASVTQAIQAVLGGSTGGIDNTGGVNHPETPFVDAQR